jgi:hypothetical protein
VKSHHRFQTEDAGVLVVCLLVMGVEVVMFADTCTGHVDVEFSFERGETKKLSCFLTLNFRSFLPSFLAGQELSCREWMLGVRAELHAADEASQPGTWCRCQIRCHVC